MKKLFITIIVLAIGFLVYYFSFGEPNSSPAISPLPEISLSMEAVFAEPIVYTSLKNNYSGDNFSFKYPDGFKALSNMVAEDEGEVVTIENNKGSGFQIFVSVFDEPGPITPEKIQEDLPEAVINDPKNAQLDSSKALVFNGYDDVFGDTFEVWVINKGRLYQIVGPKTATKLITETLETWNWKLY